ncbi:Hypothetical predicted protein [Paramuricea clavata]|uniref:Uncharacterized protein n=1 Tax=Paramuricea clavata TaxID=317549 RepID=A0A7D9I7L0_PARCT|nr:Hypothetical predicted protein [Paramuricea clavata]
MRARIKRRPQDRKNVFHHTSICQESESRSAASFDELESGGDKACGCGSRITTEIRECKFQDSRKDPRSLDLTPQRPLKDLKAVDFLLSK